MAVLINHFLPPTMFCDTEVVLQLAGNMNNTEYNACYTVNTLKKNPSLVIHVVVTWCIVTVLRPLAWKAGLPSICNITIQ